MTACSSSASPAAHYGLQYHLRIQDGRIVLTGVFCEQPPLNLIKSLELSGCYVVDDDFQLCQSMLLDDVHAIRTKTTTAAAPAMAKEGA